VRLGHLTASVWAWSVLVGAPTAAQHRGQVAARGVVAIAPPALAAVGDLQFDILRGGTAITIDPRSSGHAAKLVIVGASRVEFALDFGLPDTLVADGGLSALAVRFGPAGACLASHDRQAACELFDPSTTLRDGGGTGHYIWLGGTVETDPTLQPGTYIGIVTVTVQYTGI